MHRLNQLNKLHGIKTTIQVYNSYYNIDLLRCTNNEFNKVLASITVMDVLRISALADDINKMIAA